MTGGAGSDNLSGGGNDVLDAAAPGVIDTAVDTLLGGEGFDTAVGAFDPFDLLIEIEDDQRT